MGILFLQTIFIIINCLFLQENNFNTYINYGEHNKIVELSIPVIVIFEEGFKNDNVTVMVNDREIIKKTEMSTKKLLGYASSAKLDVTSDSVKFEIILPEKHLSKTILIEDVSKPFALIVSIENDMIKYNISYEPEKLGYG